MYRAKTQVYIHGPLLCWAMAAFLTLAGCDDGSNTPAGDGGQPTSDTGVDSATPSNDSGPGNGADGSPDAADTGVDTQDAAHDAPLDDGASNEAAVPADAEPDTAPDSAADAAKSDPYADLPAGQCRNNDDCPLGPDDAPGNCSRTAPGGTCTGCGSDDHCPGGTSCLAGYCIRSCGGPLDCPPGWECSSPDGGRCRIQSCLAGECPVPLFGCSASGTRCARHDCGSGEPCPAGTDCLDGRCIEGHGW